MTTAAGQPLPAGAWVLRALAVKDVFFEPPEHRTPTPDAFKPNSADIKEGERRGLPVGVSVFDRARTTPEQAVAIRCWFAQKGGRDPPEYRVLEIAADQVRDIARAYNPDADVISDPITDEGARDLPGADGHAAIRGLYQPDRKQRQSPDYKAMLDRLAGQAQHPPDACSL